MRNFFLAPYFSPYACRQFAKYSKFKGDNIFEMYELNGVIEFNVPNHVVFLPRSILNPNFSFGKIVGENKRLILYLQLSDEHLEKLVTALGGSIKKKANPPPPPTLGDLMKNI